MLYIFWFSSISKLCLVNLYFCFVYFLFKLIEVSMWVDNPALSFTLKWFLNHWSFLQENQYMRAYWKVISPTHYPLLKTRPRTFQELLYILEVAPKEELWNVCWLNGYLFVWLEKWILFEFSVLFTTFFAMIYSSHKSRRKLFALKYL